MATTRMYFGRLGLEDAFWAIAPDLPMALFLSPGGGVRGSEHALAGDKKLVLIHMVLQAAPLFMVSNFNSKFKSPKDLYFSYPHGPIKSYR